MGRRRLYLTLTAIQYAGTAVAIAGFIVVICNVIDTTIKLNRRIEKSRKAHEEFLSDVDAIRQLLDKWPHDPEAREELRTRVSDMALLNPTWQVILEMLGG